MTPQERQLVDDLFGRLSKMESAPRDPDATSAIVQGLRGAPNAVYALVQTVLVQDEALKRANSRIQELEAGGAPEQTQSGGFLDSMRDAIFGQNQPHGSVPNVRPPETANRPVWNSGQVMQQAQSPGQYNQDPYGQPYGAPQSPMGGGGSFLGTAAAAAAGVVVGANHCPLPGLCRPRPGASRGAGRSSRHPDCEPACSFGRPTQTMAAASRHQELSIINQELEILRHQSAPIPEPYKLR